MGEDNKSTKPDVDDNLFTKQDVEDAITRTTGRQLASVVARNTTGNHNVIIGNFKEIYRKLKSDDDPVYSYNNDKYTNIYAIGDINADYLTLVKMLIGFGLIDYNNKTEIKIDDYELISNVEWVAPDYTLLVICGNVIGGWTSGGFQLKQHFQTYKNEDNNRNEDEGYNEVLIHMFLRNIKKIAQKKGGDVILIGGDRDIHWEDDYIHKKAIAYYKKFDKNNHYYSRYLILKPFYKKNFIDFFSIKNSKVDVLFINGGLGIDTKLIDDKNNYIRPFNVEKRPNNIRFTMDMEQDKLINYLQGNKIWHVVNKNIDDYDSIDIYIPKDIKIKESNIKTVVYSDKANSYQLYPQKNNDDRPCSNNVQEGMSDDILNSKVIQNTDRRAVPAKQAIAKNTPHCIYPKDFNGDKPTSINIHSGISKAENSRDIDNNIIEILKIEDGTFYATSLDLKGYKIKELKNEKKYEYNLSNEKDNYMLKDIKKKNTYFTNEENKYLFEKNEANYVVPPDGDYVVPPDGGKKRSTKKRKPRKTRRKSNKRSRRRSRSRR